MRLTIIAGLIVGASLAIQSMLGAHVRTKVGEAASAVRVHGHVVAPWYVAMNGRPCGGAQRGSRRQSCNGNGRKLIRLSLRRCRFSILTETKDLGLCT
jgi:hypothetical protein